MKIQIIAFFIFSLLVISFLSSASAYDLTINSDNSKKASLGNIDPTNTNNLHRPQKFQINLSENIGIAENIPQKNDPGQVPKLHTYTINMVERIALTENTNNKQIVFVVIKQYLDPKTSMDRISNLERIRFNGRSILTENFYSTEQSFTNKISQIENNFVQYTENNIDQSLEKIFHANIIPNISLAYNDINTDLKIIQPVENEIAWIAHVATDPKNPTILLLLVPLSGYILIRTEEEKFQFFKSKQVLSFCFVAIIMSSIIVSPLSISPEFWNAVYAEQMNDTGTNDTLPIGPQTNSTITNSTTLPIGPQTNSTITNSTTLPIGPQTNSTITNSTTLPIGPQTNYTITNSTTLPIGPQTNSTITNSTTLPIGPQTNSTIPTNNTAHSDTPITQDQLGTTDKTTVNSTSILPNATKSWQFNSIQNSTNVGSAKIQNASNTTSLKLVGAGYLTQQINSTRSLSALTLSAWVKPDYSQGSPQFTIISKENQFVLSINNIISPQKIATFSIFDGIKWSTVNSTIPIEQNWTHLAATFNGSSIAIYVNGTLQQTMQISGIPTIDVNGKLATKTVDQISSDADIIIGAYLDSIRGITPRNQFSGLIQNVDLYDSLLIPSQIAELYSSDVLSGLVSMQVVNSIPVNATLSDNPIILDQISLTDKLTLNSTSLLSINATTITNSTLLDNFTSINDTQLTINPQLKAEKQSYLITENPHLDFQFFNDSSILKIGDAKIKKELSQIDKAERILNVTELTLNSTATKDHLTSDANVQDTQQQINAAQDQIDQAQQQIQDTQQTIQQALTNPSPQMVSETISQIQETQKQIQDVKQQINDTTTQIADLGKNFTKVDAEIKQIISTTNKDIQIGQWNGDNETIKVQVQGPDNKIINIQSQISQILDGKYNITLSSSRDIIPGIYTVETTLVKDGKNYTTDDQFAWGLVSLNTNKSIYKPGEIANFTIVVLDNGGHSVCDANIMMNIVDPNGLATILSSGNGITANSECGLYDAQYTTKSEGSYAVDVTAQNPSGTTNFSTSFLVQNSIAFDVIRTAESKIDPVDNPNSFNVKIDIQSYVNQNNIQIQEFVPSVFDVITDANVQTVGDTKVLSWNKDLIGDKTSIQYLYSVPLKYPKLYALGPAKISYGGNKTFDEARPWFIAVDPNNITTGTKFYFHSLQTSNAPTAGEKSAALTATIANSGAVYESLSMSTFLNKTAAAGVTRKLVTDALTTQNNDYIARFTSPTLAAQTLSAGNWTIGIFASESAAQANNFGAGSLYIWRPSTSSVVGYIFDGPSGAGHHGTEWTTILTGRFFNATGASITTKSGDVLVFEQWEDRAQISGPRTNTINFDGTVASTNGTITNAGMFIQAIQIITLGTNRTDSLTISDSITTKLNKLHLSESLSLSDSIKKSLSRTFLESESLQDTLSVQKTLSRTQTESLPISDQLSIKQTLSRTLSESLPLSDQVRAIDTNLHLSESLSLSDSIKKSFPLHLSESLSLQDTLSVQKTLSRTQTESLPISDQLSIKQTLSRTLSESVPITDTLAIHTPNRNIQLSESL
ncbi:MAG: hypothetical protein HY222_07895, partial [Thaumarchaeota archaeon]|nr:hypothetical protein [Nitrososphaerota archaeon]